MSPAFAAPSELCTCCYVHSGIWSGGTQSLTLPPVASLPPIQSSCPAREHFESWVSGDLSRARNRHRRLAAPGLESALTAATRWGEGWVIRV